MCYSCCWLGFVGVSVVLIPAAATSAAGAARTRAAALDTVSTEMLNFFFRVMTVSWKVDMKIVCRLQFMKQVKA